MPLSRLSATVLTWVLLTALASKSSELPTASPIRLRRPIAVQLVDDGRRLLIVNRDGGSVQLVDTASRAILTEVPIGRKLGDLAAADRIVVAVDEYDGRLIILSRDGDVLRVTSQRSIGMSPVSVRLTDDGKTAIVGLQWPKRLTFVPLVEAGELAMIDLPFAPRRVCVVPGYNKAIIADGFGGQMAVVDLVRKSVAGVRDFGGHNLRGLALDPSRQNLYVTHQFLNSTAATQKGEIQNGNVLSNNVRRVSLGGLLNSGGSLTEQAYSIGDIERGAGDPADVAVGDDGRVYVTLAGVNELAIGTPDDVVWTRIPVGRRPTALALDRAKSLAYVANTFDDSISVVDARAGKVITEIRLGAKDVELRPEERGEILFHDARRSHDAWMSCQSCHPDGHTNGRLNDNFSDGSFGTPKRVLSLLGVKDTAPWAWNGNVASLEDQVRNSFKTTMQGPTPTGGEVGDLVAYLRTLSPPPSLAVARGEKNPRERGERLFENLGCVKCHKPASYTTPKTYDVGLDDGGEYNPPSLRGVSQGGPYFHDGRARSLEEVLSRVRHQLPRPMTAAEQSDLIAFLNSI